MSKIAKKRIEVLTQLLAGKRLKSKQLKSTNFSYSWEWEDGSKTPGLADVVSSLYRAGLVEDEVKDPTGWRCGDNLTGYTVITTSGEIWVERSKEAP